MSQCVDDIFKLYLDARKFCDGLPVLLRMAVTRDCDG
jgi:hypothetical protein